MAWDGSRAGCLVPCDQGELALNERMQNVSVGLLGWFVLSRNEVLGFPKDQERPAAARGIDIANRGSMCKRARAQAVSNTEGNRHLRMSMSVMAAPL